MMLSVLLTFLISIIYVQAFVITQPDSKGWPRNVGLMMVRWTTSPTDPPVFTMLLRDASQSSVINPFAVANNVPSAPGSFELDLPTVPTNVPAAICGYKKSHPNIGNFIHVPHHQFPNFNLVRNYHTEYIHSHIDNLIHNHVDTPICIILNTIHVALQLNHIFYEFWDFEYHYFINTPNDSNDYEHLGNTTIGNGHRDSHPGPWRLFRSIWAGYSTAFILK
ncbi:unnamed protein product [Rhizoctonia solani]|uniref:Uncharacterized protein n=1 Tax=Rhizoctonia solani TaxID=456999 RepID=A0A8H3D6U7_9AGAM|nr:unnamed protein product [Rhizoctonia solani]